MEFEEGKPEETERQRSSLSVPPTVIVPITSKVTFDDIGGCRVPKTELMQLARRFNQPSVVHRWGGRMPKAVLLNGPKGTGKTTLAYAFANAVGRPFFPCKPSDILSVWVNHSGIQLDSLIQQVRKVGGVILFDEADALLGKRGGSSSHNEDDKLVNAWNVCMDHLGSEDGVIIFLTTNFMEKLDDAAIREGRVDKVITVTMPKDDGERREIFRSHIIRMQRRAGTRIFKQPIDLSLLARYADGLSPAAIESAVLLAADRKIDADLEGEAPGLIGTEDLVAAIVCRLAERNDQAKRSIGF